MRLNYASSGTHITPAAVLHCPVGMACSQQSLDLLTHQLQPMLTQLYQKQPKCTPNCRLALEVTLVL